MGPDRQGELQDVTISCKDHGKLLVNGLKQLLEEDYLVDANLIFKGTSFKVHRLILAVFLPTLKAHMNNAHGNVLSGDSHVLSMDYVANEVEDVQLLLEFLYTGRVTVQRERMQQICQLAKNLNVECLSKAIGELESAVERSVDILDKDGTNASNPKLDREEICVEPFINSNVRMDFSAVDNSVSTESASEMKQRAHQDINHIKRCEKHLQGRNKSTCANSKRSVPGGTLSSDMPLKMKPSVRLRGKVVSQSTTSKNTELVKVKATRILETRCKSEVTKPDEKRIWSGCALHPGRFSNTSDWSRVVSVTQKSKKCVLHQAAKSKVCGTSSGTVSVSPKNIRDPKENDAVDRINKLGECHQTLAKGCTGKLSKKSTTNVGDLLVGVEKLLTCDKCNKMFITTRGLGVHQNVCCLPKKHSCKECGFCTESHVILKKHLSAAHKKEDSAKVVRCSECDYTTNAKSNLRRHIAWQHTAEREHKCPECEYSAMYRGEIDRHVSLAHRKERKFMCELCGGRFSVRQCLNRHILKQHQGIKPFKCEYCGKEYREKKSLTIHVQTKHTFDVQRHVCEICGKSYIKRWGLQYHLRHTHGTSLEPLKKPYGPRIPPVQQEQGQNVTTKNEMPNLETANFEIYEGNLGAIEGVNGVLAEL